MVSSKKNVSCIPCAKRKVRCDKVLPCCHCKRRKQDRCVYPELGGANHQLLREQTERIEKLELYIRSLGGDPRLVDQGQIPCSNLARQKLPENTSITKPDRNGVIGPSDPLSHDLSSFDRACQPFSSTSELFEHDDGVTCIETPMWYSWKDQDRTSSHHGSHTQALSDYYLPTLLSQKQTLDVSNPFTPLPPALHLSVLWPIFLKNVHPMVKIFFDWEVAPIVEKTQKQALDLSSEEQALVNGIRFIAALTLAREDCQDLLSESKYELLLHCQRSSEHALISANYTETTSKCVLQAFMLYILAMRDRTRPAAIYALMGIATRIAERLGLHHDGTMFGLDAVRSEERRRMWWQLQSMEISVARLVGTLSLTIFANWDTKPPSNLEDSDFYPPPDVMPNERKGLTSISSCLWKYSILNMHRDSRGKDSSTGLSALTSPHTPLAEKDAAIDRVEKMLAERFLQYCELLNPLHVYMQIGIRQFVLAARSNARQPTLVNAKLSEISPQTRDDLLEISSKSLEYFVMSQSTSSISCFSWENDNFFRVASFVYLVLEAYQRYDKHEVVDIWALIGRVYNVHPDLMTAVSRPEVTFIARITVAAWQKYYVYMRQQNSGETGANSIDTPEWIRQVCHNFRLPLTDLSATTDEVAQTFDFDPAQILPTDFDFDMIDWSAWEALLQGPTEDFAG